MTDWVCSKETDLIDFLQSELTKEQDHTRNILSHYNSEKLKWHDTETKYQKQIEALQVQLKQSHRNKQNQLAAPKKCVTSSSEDSNKQQQVVVTEKENSQIPLTQQKPLKSIGIQTNPTTSLVTTNIKPRNMDTGNNSIISTPSIQFFREYLVALLEENVNKCEHSLLRCESFLNVGEGDTATMATWVKVKEAHLRLKKRLNAFFPPNSSSHMNASNHHSSSQILSRKDFQAIPLSPAACGSPFIQQPPVPPSGVVVVPPSSSTMLIPSPNVSEAALSITNLLNTTTRSEEKETPSMLHSTMYQTVSFDRSGDGGIDDSRELSRILQDGTDASSRITGGIGGGNDRDDDDDEYSKWKSNFLNQLGGDT
eukprot:PhF_6_TR6225/c1_g1_i2/m.9397